MRFWLVTAIFVFLSAPASDAGVLARFQMNNDLGTMDVELFETDRPTTVSNFIAYVKSGAWHDTLMNRWLPNYIVQGGSRHLSHAADLMTPISTAHTPVTKFPSIPFEANIGPKMSNLAGTIAMARAGTDLNSASTDWFFNIKDNLNLDTQDGGYTVFGKIVRGTATLNRFIQGGSQSKVYLLQDGSTPVYSTDGVNGFWINTDITLLTVEIARASRGVSISWISVEGRPNIVEYANVIPPVWHPLQTVTGTGAKMSAIDGNSIDAARQYRVRIDYSN